MKGHMRSSRCSLTLKKWHTRRTCGAADGPEARDSRGQSMIEFALTLPIIIILFVVVVVFSFMLYAHVTMSHSAREGTRYIVGSPQASDVEVETYVKSKLGILDKTRAVIVISPEPADRDPGENVTVQISYPFQVVNVYVPYIISPGGFRMFPPVWVTAVSTMYMD